MRCCPKGRAASMFFPPPPSIMRAHGGRCTIACSASANQEAWRVYPSATACSTISPCGDFTPAALGMRSRCTLSRWRPRTRRAVAQPARATAHTNAVVAGRARRRAGRRSSISDSSGSSRATTTATPALPSRFANAARRAWRAALPLLRLHGERIYSESRVDVIAPNMFAGSILDLAARHGIRGRGS